MERRKFLTGTALATVTGAASGGENRLFGAPNSLVAATQDAVNVLTPHLLKLHLNLADVPASEHENWLAFTQIANDIIADPGSAKRFQADPESYLTAAGFKNVNVDVNSHQIQFVTALADPKLREAAREGDAAAFLNALQNRGLVPKRVPYCDELVCVQAYVVVYVFVAAAVLAVALAYGVPAENQTAFSQLALLSGGKPFARDVIKEINTHRVDDFIQAINDGRVEVPLGQFSKEEFIASIRVGMAKHFP